MFICQLNSCVYLAYVIASVVRLHVFQLEGMDDVRCIGVLVEGDGREAFAASHVQLLAQAALPAVHHDHYKQLMPNALITGSLNALKLEINN